MLLQIFENTVLKGTRVGTFIRTSRGLMLDCVLKCGHNQLVPQADLQAELTPTCATCLTSVELKARGIETDKQFRDWHDRRAISLPRNRTPRTEVDEGFPGGTLFLPEVKEGEQQQ
jgi:hypothetical protein